MRGEVAALCCRTITAYVIRRWGTVGPRRAGLARGQLPRINPIRIWVDDGTWQVCAVCLEEIIESMTEYELQFEMPFGPDQTQRMSFWFHKLCFATWLVERVRQ